MSAHPLRGRLITDMRRVWPDPPRGGRADPYVFMPTVDLIARLVQLRPDTWGTIRDARPLTAQLLESILRSGDYPDAAHTERVAGRKGRSRSAMSLLLDTVPAETARTAFGRPGTDAMLVEFAPGTVEWLIEGGGLCTILPIVHQFPGDRALITAYRLTPVDSNGTLAP